MKKTPYEILQELVEGFSSHEEVLIRKTLIAAIKKESTEEYISALRGLNRMKMLLLQEAIDVYKEIGVMLVSDQNYVQPSDRTEHI